MFNPDNFAYFVFKRRFNASYGFTTYMDKETGDLRMISSRKDKDGNPIPRRFKFSLKERTIRIPKTQTDAYGNNVVEFLLDHPECEGSKNGTYVVDSKTGESVQKGVYFGLLDTEKDAGNALQAKEERIKAENYALSLNDEDLIDVAALLGIIGKSPAVTKHKVLEAAGNTPKSFLDLVERKDRKALSLIRQGLSLNVLSKKGQLISWEDTILGSDEDKASKQLLDDDKLMSALEDAILRSK